MNRKTLSRLRAGLPALPIVFLSACGGGGGDGGGSARQAPVTEAVPAAVASSPMKATDYTSQLAATPSAEGDTLEPVSVPDRLATDDTAEPV